MLRISDHARERMVERNIPPKYIPLVMKVGTPVKQRLGRVRYNTKNLAVVVDRSGYVVTAIRRGKT